MGDSVGRAWLESAKERSFVLVVASDGVVNERFGSRELTNVVEDSLQSSWEACKAKSSSLREVNGAHFLNALSTQDLADCAKSVLTASEGSNYGDNQSIHLAHVIQRPQGSEHGEVHCDDLHFNRTRTQWKSACRRMPFQSLQPFAIWLL